MQNFIQSDISLETQSDVKENRNILPRKITGVTLITPSPQTEVIPHFWPQSEVLHMHILALVIPFHVSRLPESSEDLQMYGRRLSISPSVQKPCIHLSQLINRTITSSVSEKNKIKLSYKLMVKTLHKTEPYMRMYVCVCVHIFHFI